MDEKKEKPFDPKGEVTLKNVFEPESVSKPPVQERDTTGDKK